MKNLLNVLLFALLFASFSTKATNTLAKLFTKAEQTYPQEYFKGFWLGRGYTCNTGGQIPEDIDVTYVGDEFIATKVTGDDCVTTGTVTFKANLRDAWTPTNGKYNIKCTITLGNPSRPNSTESKKCNIEIVNENEFKVTNWNLTFNRGRASYPKDYFLGFWIGDGYKCTSSESLPEDINVHYEDNKFVAVKVKGDECVNKGKVTFQGPLTTTDKWTIKTNFKWDIGCTITLGNPSNPQSSSGKCTIEIIDEDHFSVLPWKLNFRRGRLPQPNYHYDYFKGGWLGLNYTCDEKKLSAQDIRIEYDTGYLHATKITGDDCIHTGSLSFKAVLQEEYRVCENSWNIPCAIVFGSKDAPSSIFTHKCSIEIVDDDHFKIPEYGLDFKRKPCENHGF